jgi:hypothetical protein
MSHQVGPLRVKLSGYKRRWLQSRVIANQRHTVDFAFIHVPKCGGTSVTSAIGQRIKLHDTARERRDKLGVDRWNEIYTFSIVRHAYDRTLSYYKFIKNTMYAHRLGGLSLNDWVRAALRDKNIFPTVASRDLAPCSIWLMDETNNILVDDIAKLETLSDSWPEIMRRTGVKRVPPHMNKSDGGLLRDAFDNTSLKILQTHFRVDFEAFNYEE